MVEIDHQFFCYEIDAEENKNWCEILIMHITYSLINILV